MRPDRQKQMLAYLTRPATDNRVGFYEGKLVTEDGPNKGKYKVKFSYNQDYGNSKFKGVQYGTKKEIEKLIADRKIIADASYKSGVSKAAQIAKDKANVEIKNTIDSFIEKGDYENFKTKPYESQLKQILPSGNIRQSTGGRVNPKTFQYINDMLAANDFENLSRITGRSEQELINFKKQIPEKGVIDEEQRAKSAEESYPEERKLTEEQKQETEKKVQAKRKDRLETAVKKAGKGVADINKAQDETIALLNKFYKDNPQELLGNTKLRNLLDLTLKDGELVKKNKYVTDEDFLKLIKDKTGLFTKDHIDEVQFEKLSTEFPIFKQLATYNTNSGLIRSIKAYVVKNQNSTDPGVQNKIKKQIEFLEDLKLRIDTPTGRVGSKEVLNAVDRQAGTLPNFLAQLRALNIKLPAKAKAVLLGTGGGLAATTLATAGPIEETGSTAMDTAKIVGAAGTGVAAVGTKPGRKLLGKAFRTLGTPLAGTAFAANQVRSNIQSGENVADAVLDPLVGLELSFPGLFKENVAKITKNPTAQRLLNLAIPFGRFARLTTPVGLGITAAGLGIDAAKFSRDRIRELRAMSPEQRQELRSEGARQAFDPFMAAGGGIAKLAGVDSGPPPESGPNSQGLQGLMKRVRNR